MAYGKNFKGQINDWKCQPTNKHERQKERKERRALKRVGAKWQRLQHKREMIEAINDFLSEKLV